MCLLRADRFDRGIGFIDQLLVALLHRHAAISLLEVQFLEEVVALVINHDERREVLDFDTPDGFHTELWVLDHFYLLDAILCQACGGTTDRPQVEASVTRAGVADLTRAV